MTASGIALRRLAAQGIATRGSDDPADVVRRFAAIQAQDYGQSLWAVGARLRRGTLAQVEDAIADRRIVRTWLMRGTIHLAAPEDVRWLLGLCAPRLAVAEERRREQLGLTRAEIDRCAGLLRAALAGDRRLSRPDVFALFEGAGIETARQRGYHILVRLARDALICIGPMQGKHPTFVLLDDWAPPAEARRIAGAKAVADLAARFVATRGPVTDQDLARWAGITLGDARQGLRDAGPAVATRSLDGTEYWLAADRADAPVSRAGRGKAFLLPGFDEYILGYKDRESQLAPEHSAKVVPGANGVFKPIIVVGGQVVGTWARRARPPGLTIALQPFTAVPDLAELVQVEVRRYCAFLGLPASNRPVVVVEETGSAA
jgi:hypothetical protein